MAKRNYITNEMIDAILEMHEAKPELSNIQLGKCFALSDGTISIILRGQHPLQLKAKEQQSNHTSSNLALITALSALNDTIKSIDSSLLLIADALIKDETEPDKEDEHESA